MRYTVESSEELSNWTSQDEIYGLGNEYVVTMRESVFRARNAPQPPPEVPGAKRFWRVKVDPDIDTNGDGIPDGEQLDADLDGTPDSNDPDAADKTAFFPLGPTPIGKPRLPRPCR